MKKRRVYLILIGIVILGFLTGNLAYPKYIKSLIPQFWDIPFRLGLDLQGGTHLIYEADLANIDKEDFSSAMQGLRDIIERRVNLFGVTEPIIQTQESGNQHRLVVELAGIKDPAEAIKMIGQTPFLEFKKQRNEEDRQRILDKQTEVDGLTYEEMQKIEGWQIAFDDPYFEPTGLTGQYLEKAELSFDQQMGTPLILIQFDGEGSALFEQLTSENIGKILAIYIDNVPISTPVVQDKISGGRAQITGDFTIDEAKELARNLNAGALPVPIKLISQQSIGPTLGAVSLEKSLNAGLIGFLIVILFLIIFYKLPGLLASLSLAVYVALILSLFKLIPVTLTLAGIAGFLISIGMAIDANILIFERMKEEIRDGRSIIAAIDAGFIRAWTSIRDSNVATLITCIILYYFGSGLIRGFAVTLGIGVIVSMFSAITITYTLLRLLSSTGLANKISWWGAVKK